MRFVFGCDTRANLIREADALPARAWTSLVRRPLYQVQTESRQRPVNVKEAIIVERAAAVLRMAFKAFLQAFMLIPVHVVRTSRRLVFRLLAWNPGQAVFLRGFDHWREPLRY